MQKVAKFYKVSFKQFKADYLAIFGSLPNNIEEIYENIKLPKRATHQSAGYDFFSPVEITLSPKKEILLPTGIRCKMKGGVVLAVVPRSSLGFKFRLQLNNTVGIIDADYFGAENEGHIMLKLFNDTIENKTVSLSVGSAVAQGIFLNFGITEDDETSEVRTGGFGSTG